MDLARGCWVGTNSMAAHGLDIYIYIYITLYVAHNTTYTCNEKVLLVLVVKAMV